MTLVKKRQNSSTFYFFRCKNTRNHRRLTICTSLDYRRETILEKKRQKSSHFYFSTPLKPSVYADFFRHQSCGNRETCGWQDKNSKNRSKIFPFKKNMCFKCSKYKDFSGCASWTYRKDKNVLVKKSQKSS